MPINGFVYHCQNQNLNLHPNCMELKKHYKVRDDDNKVVYFNLDKKVRGKCTWCKKKSINANDHDNNGWSYESECGKYHAHVACVHQMVVHRKKMNHHQVTHSTSISEKGEFESNSEGGDAEEDIYSHLFSKGLFKRKGWALK
ncbi:uncharacterized protein LOC111006135 [Momordica charantia]|uniref:Uncharacterized protein LOC111006135 n=1 Tax=Momordica charantia TaxID=3673 RepID=A0A6J1BVJ9_MOMCH|nr:uncharacterized protein LOC111006135 [Momordica charantia]